MPDQAGPTLTIEPTPGGWLPAVMVDFDEFLKDHASCEKKASGMALSIASHYPDRPALLGAMADLALEEMNHFREVIRVLLARGITPGPDRRDPYVRALNGLIRRGPHHYLLDRLLIAAVVERRGSERFAIIADALDHHPERFPDSESESLATFYRAIAASEGRHWKLFVDLARHECPAADVDERLSELAALEADIMLAQPFRAALH